METDDPGARQEPRISPVVLGDQATFRYYDRGATEVGFVADSTAFRPVPMERNGSGWVLSRTYPSDARDEYLFVVDGNWILDPLNPLRGTSPFGPHSECRMPGYSIPRPVEPPVDGSLEHRTLAGREVDVYVPAQREGAALLVVQDGRDYVRFTGMPGLLDALIRERSIPPVLAVFISPLDRDAEYRPNDQYVSWLADELAPAAVVEYAIDPAPGRHGLMGASLGGLIAAYAAILRPEVFRLIGAQSPAFRIIRGGMGRLLDSHTAPWPDMRFHVDGGTFEETLHASEFLPSIRRSVQALRGKGCAVQYTEVNEGHNWTNWRGRLPDLLTWLFGPAR